MLCNAAASCKDEPYYLTAIPAGEVSRFTGPVGIILLCCDVRQPQIGTQFLPALRKEGLRFGIAN